MDLERRTPDGGALTRWETRAQAAFGTGRRQFVYQWTAPRSPVARIVLAPVLIVAALVVFVLALVLFALLFGLVLAAGIVAAIVWRLGPVRR